MAKKKEKDEGDLIVGATLLFAFSGAAAAMNRWVHSHVLVFILIAAGLALIVGFGFFVWTTQVQQQKAVQAQRDRQVATTDGMSGKDFEELVARLLERDGFRAVTIPGGAGDLGADVMATDPHGRRVVIQCKRYAQHRAVSSPDMQKFLGTCFHEHEAEDAWFVTTTRFSKPAADLANRRGVLLIDREALAAWMTHGPGALPQQRRG